MSTRLGGAESGSNAVFGVNASKSENGVAQVSETLADDLLVKLAGVERKGCASAADDDGFCELKRETDSVDGETSGGEVENDSDSESEAVCEKRDLDSSGKQNSEVENLGAGVLAGSASANENLKLSDSDLVWAKVRSYPWWPGQVFDASVASKNAIKYFKEGHFLVAYFGDTTFAWNDVSMIKPFHQHFSQMEKQSSSEELRVAIDCALEEVSRRVEFGLSCPCISEEAYNNLKAQNIVNPGIREDSRVRYGGDKLANAIFFKPAKLVEYMKHLACFPNSYDATDKLMFVNSRAQLSAFQQWKSYLIFPKYETFLRSVDSAAPEPLTSQPEPNTVEEMSTKKRKTDIKDNAGQKQRFGFGDRTDEKTKDKILSRVIANRRFGSRSIEKMDGKSHSDKKRKVESSESGKSEKKIKNNTRRDDPASKISDEESNSSIGNKLQKVADPCFAIVSIPLRLESEMNYLTPTLYPAGDSNSASKVEAKNKKTNKPKHEELAPKMISSPDEMISSLHSAKPREGTPKSFSVDHSNYADFEKFIEELSCSTLNDDSKKVSISETLEPRDVKEFSAEQILHTNKDLNGLGSKEQTGLKHCSAGSSTPNALILKFAASGSAPSEEKLNSIFNRYGPLRESETQVMKKGKRAKVVFKRGEDAQTAFSSSGKYSIFGPSLLSYTLKYVCPKTKQGNNITN